MLIPLTHYCDVDYLFLIIPGSLIVLDNHFLACLYFVSCLLIKIRINLWTTQLSQSLLLVTWIWGYWSSLILTQTLLILSLFWVIISMSAAERNSFSLTFNLINFDHSRATWHPLPPLKIYFHPMSPWFLWRAVGTLVIIIDYAHVANDL